MTTYTVTRAYYSAWDGDPRAESVIFVIDGKFQTHIRRADFQRMTNEEVDARLQNDCEWWDAKVNNTNVEYEPTAAFNARVASFVDDKFIV